MNLRVALPFVVAGVAAAAVSAAAATVGGLGTPGLGADTVVVGSCTETGISSQFVIDATDVTAVALTGFPDSCLGQTVHVTVAGVAGAQTAASAALSGSSAVLALPHPVAVWDVISLSLVVSG